MLVRDHGGKLRLPAGTQDDAGAVLGVTLDDLPLLRGELARLLQHLRRRVRLADVVKKRGLADVLDILTGHSDGLGQGHRQDRDVQRVNGRVLVVAAHGNEELEKRPAVLEDYGEGLDDGPCHGQRDEPPILRLVEQVVDRLRLFLELRSRGRLLRFILQLPEALPLPDGERPDPRMGEVDAGRSLGRGGRRIEQLDEGCEEAVELLPVDALGNLDALRARVGQHLRPMPFAQLAEPPVGEDDLALEEGVSWCRERLEQREQ